MNFFNSLFSTSKPQQPTTTSTSRPIDPFPQAEEKRILELPTPSPPPTATVPPPHSTPYSPTTTPKPPPPPQSTSRLDQNRNAVVFGAGAAFFALSLLITRRSFARRRLATNPAFYTDSPANAQHQTGRNNVSGAMEAVEALNLATINVLSVAMMSTGGLLWYLDINSMDDARRKLRGGLGVDGSGGSREDDERRAEEDFEEWMATVLARKEAKGKAGGGGVGEEEKAGKLVNARDRGSRRDER